VEMGKRFVNDLTGIELEALVEGIARAAERHATGNKVRLIKCGGVFLNIQDQ